VSANRSWPIIKPSYHQRSKITHVEPKCFIFPNQFERDQATLQRQLSECSDDFICFETDSNLSDSSDVESDIDDGEYDALSTDSELDSDDEHGSAETNPPESGFEEKKVRFNLQPKVHRLHVWKFAYSQARKGKWEEIGRDRGRFGKRVQDAEPILAPILQANHRNNVFNQRFNN